MMVRGNLPAAMQGMVVVPIFAGYDPRRGQGRLFDYDVTGGRYEERDYVATGSGSLHAGTVIKVGYRDGHEPRRGRRPVRARRCGRRPTTTPPPAAPTRCAASTRRGARSPPRASSGSPTTSWPTAFEAASPSRSVGATP